MSENDDIPGIMKMVYVIALVVIVFDLLIWRP